MKSKIVLWCLLAAVALTAGDVLAADSFMEFIGTGGTLDYNVAANWQQLVWDITDPNDPNYADRKLVWSDPAVHRVPANNSDPNALDEMAFVRNGATITVVDTMPNISAIEIGTAGDVTRDANGYILARPASTIGFLENGRLNTRNWQGVESDDESTIGASYDGVVNIYGGQFQPGSNLYIGALGASNPGGSVPYQGKGQLNMSSGELNTGYDFVYVGSGSAAQTNGSRAQGTVNITGGWFETDGLAVGGNGGIGYMTVSEDDEYTPTTIRMSEGSSFMQVGDNGRFVPGEGYDPNGWATGTYIQNGGSVNTANLIVGEDHGIGEFVLNGGTFALYTGNETHIGQGGSTGGTLTQGYGHLTINDGYFDGFNTRTKFIIGRGGGGNYVSAPGYGTFTMNGGRADFVRQNGGNSLEFGNVNGSNSVGVLELFGGTLSTDQTITFGKNYACTGILHLGSGGYGSFGALLMGGPESGAGSTTKMIVDIAPDNSTGRIEIKGGTATFQGTLHVDTGLGRPKEGDMFPKIVRLLYGGVINQDFTFFTSNITNGLKADPNDPNYLFPAFDAEIVAYDPCVPGSYSGYQLTFQALTWGDANGDHAVDGGDLALMGGNWMVTSGRVWLDGDFNGDGAVNGGDLALMGGNWMWTLPAPAPGQAIPEPATLALLAMGGVAMIRRRR